MLPHTRQSGRTMTSVSVGHIYTETDPTRGGGGGGGGAGGHSVDRSRDLLTRSRALNRLSAPPPPPLFAVSTAVKIKSVSPFFSSSDVPLLSSCVCNSFVYKVLHDYVMEKDKNGKQQISLRFQPFEHAFFKAEKVCIKTKASIIKVCIDDIEGGRVHTACKYL